MGIDITLGPRHRIIPVDLWLAGGQASCCGVNLAMQG
jgi:hypothetical protein